MAPLARALVLAVLAFAGCAESESPEARIRATISAMASAVEARDVAGLKQFVASDYRDAQSRDRRELAQLVTLHTMRSRSVHVLTRIREITLRGEARADVRVVAATAGRPIEPGADLAGLRADVYLLDLQMELRERDWQVVWAQWRPAAVGEVF
jgi:hypothetical protein